VNVALDHIAISISILLRFRSLSPGSHQAVAVEGGVHAAEEHPARPQVLQPELQDEVRQQHHGPHHHAFQKGVRTVNTKRQRGQRNVLLLLLYVQVIIERFYL